MEPSKLSNTRLIVVCSTTGPQSGKSTYVNKRVIPMLQATNAPFIQLRFSDPLVSFVTAGLGLEVSSYETIKRTELIPGVTGRDIMIALGEGLREKIRPSVFAELLISRFPVAADNSEDGSTVVIDDLRKISELEALVNTKLDILFVNVLRGESLEDILANDCEFGRSGLSRFVRTYKARGFNIRLMTIMWDGKGGTVRVPNAPEVSQ